MPNSSRTSMPGAGSASSAGRARPVRNAARLLRALDPALARTSSTRFAWFAFCRVTCDGSANQGKRINHRLSLAELEKLPHEWRAIRRARYNVLRARN